MGKNYLTQNSELRADRIWCWTLPAWVAKLDDGRAVNVCPQAGACVKVCYARNGAYRFPAVKAAHQRNLLATIDTLNEWTTGMVAELTRRKFRPTGEPRLPHLPRTQMEANTRRHSR